MRVVLFNDSGESIGSFDHVIRPDDRDPANAIALLDLLEKLLETGWRDCGDGPPSSRPVPNGAAP
jgi:hypothetical protein